jgi:hypothetical protein
MKGVAVPFTEVHRAAGWKQCTSWHWQLQTPKGLLNYWPNKDKWMLGDKVRVTSYGDMLAAAGVVAPPTPPAKPRMSARRMRAEGTSPGLRDPDDTPASPVPRTARRKAAALLRDVPPPAPAQAPPRPAQAPCAVKKLTKRGTCLYCGERTTLTKDHIFPQSWGQTEFGTEANNIKRVCAPCNERRGTFWHCVAMERIVRTMCAENGWGNRDFIQRFRLAQIVAVRTVPDLQANERMMARAVRLRAVPVQASSPEQGAHDWMWGEPVRDEVLQVEGSVTGPRTSIPPFLPGEIPFDLS